MAEKLTRTSYVDVSGQPRMGTTALRESRVDVERYVQPLMNAHASALHGRGIGSGLEVRATAGAAELVVAPGVAVDAEGRHLVVAVGGSVRLDDQTLARVTAAGVTVPIAGAPEKCLVTLSWTESFDKAAFQADQVFQMMETPLVALRPEQGFDDNGAEVVLASVTLAGGTVKSLAVGKRRVSSAGVGRLAFRRPVADNPAAGTLSVQHVEAMSLFVSGDELHVPGSLVVHGSASFHGPAIGESSHIYWGEQGNWSINSARPGGWVAMQSDGGGVCVGSDDFLPVHSPQHPKLVVQGHRTWRPSPVWPGIKVPGPPGKSALFRGDVEVVGTLKKSLIQFKIDHPNAPGSKYLNHSAVESDEMKNVYDGEAVLDDAGAAEVELPGWFEALNDHVRYQLTAIGAPAPHLHVAAKVCDGRFRIAGGQPGQEICWQLTGVRRDAYAMAHPLVVEEDKTHQDQGTYLHPEAHGEPAERSVFFDPTPRPASPARKE